MPSIQPCELPRGALLGKYLQAGAYADCYVTEVAGRVAHAEYVSAFYTTALFKVERLLLGWLVAKPSNDRQAEQLASGIRDSFAAWTVEARAANQLLLCDFQGRTRSWLMVAQVHTGGNESTRLYFGSAVELVKKQQHAERPPEVRLARLSGHRSNMLERATRPVDSNGGASAITSRTITSGVEFQSAKR